LSFHEAVICDFCNADFTDSPESGGFISEGRSWAGCPRCVRKNPRVTVANTDILCPPNESFANFIRRLR